MKTFTHVSALLVLSAAMFISCQKNTTPTNLDDQPNEQQVAGVLVGSATGASTEAVEESFCSAHTSPLCAGQTIPAGQVSIQTAVSGRTYITYTTSGNWYIKELHLYVGAEDSIPVNNSGNPVPGSFPYTHTFSAPFNVQSYTFVIDGLPTSYTVAAHASLTKISGNGNVLDNQTAWGDGCTGKKIKDGSGNWGTLFYSTGTNCTIAAAQQEQVTLCSRVVGCYFGIDPLYNTPRPWVDPSVTVGGFSYSEAEARDIANTPDQNNIPKDSKYGFMNVATIKLSHTNYAASPTLAPAVATIEDWLATKNKLSPANLPSPNPQVRNAAKIIAAWIDSHICPDRR